MKSVGRIGIERNMVRRPTKNISGLPRIKKYGKTVHHAYIGFACVKCNSINTFNLGPKLITPKEAYESGNWICGQCGYKHNKNSNLPFNHWPKEYKTSLARQRFWEGFFRISTENKDSYWKRCNLCGKINPSHAFSKHKGWGPLEKQMECRPCKGAINARGNPLRTKQQLLEGSIGRRAGDLLLKGEDQIIDIDQLFKRFGNRCFKTKVILKKRNRSSWAIDHILPSNWLYPLTIKNAALLSKEANNNKRDQWPSKFYTNNDLIELAKITGANLDLLASKKSVINKNIDVNKCVKRALKVREKSDLKKRISALKNLMKKHNLINQLSLKNKTLLGFQD